jgi:DNA (cytosine-5)-methyltransferase 1
MGALSVLDLFSGIGGFSAGLHAAGKFETTAFVEKDEFCQKVLKKNFPGVPIFGDVRDEEIYRLKTDVVVGGFPCQSFSQAGARRGRKDDRYLWPEMFRIITEVKPKYVIAENVQGIVNIENGLVLRQVQDDLESEGFQVQCFLIPASGVGAWHKRNRCFILAAHPNRVRHRRGTMQGCAEEEREILQGEQEGSKVGSEIKGCGGRTEDVSNSNSKGSQGHRREYELRKDKQERKVSGKGNVGSRRTWWQTQSSICRIPDGVRHGLDKDRVNRLKSLGNAVVPQIIYQLGKAITKVEYDKFTT